jgi:hypothetical protein
MPLHPGYSRVTIARNIEKLRRENKSLGQAVGAAYASARADWLRLHPHKKLPAHLAAYTLKNPLSAIQRAAELYQSFSGHTAKVLKRIAKPKIPTVGIAIGKILGIIYQTKRDGRTEHYRHDFGAASRPLLVVSPDGRQLFMIGGSFNFTERGIVDKRKVRR